MENSSQTSQGQPDTNATTWFNELDVPTPTPPKKSRKLLIILLGVIATVGLLGAIIALISSANQRTTCLTADDFKTLTGTTLSDDISSSTNFYTSAVAFQSDSTNYDNSINDGAQGEKLLQKIAQLYKNQRKTSIEITIAGSYFKKGAVDPAQKRIDVVLSSLVALGISIDNIQTTPPTYTEPEDLDIVTQEGATTLSIVSNQACS